MAITIEPQEIDVCVCIILKWLEEKVRLARLGQSSVLSAANFYELFRWLFDENRNYPSHEMDFHTKIWTF